MYDHRDGSGRRDAGQRCHAAPVPANYFDERTAKSYEARWPELFEPAAVDPVVRFLAELAGPGAALELGIGTGRIALPLSRRGVRVHGIDLSPDMVLGEDGLAPSVARFGENGRDGPTREAM